MSLHYCIGGGRKSKTCAKECYGFATMYTGRNNKSNLPRAMLLVRSIEQGEEQVKLASSNDICSQHCIGGGAILKTCVMQYYEFALLHRWKKKK